MKRPSATGLLLAAGCVALGLYLIFVQTQLP